MIIVGSPTIFSCTSIDLWNYSNYSIYCKDLWKNSIVILVLWRVCENLELVLAQNSVTQKNVKLSPHVKTSTSLFQTSNSSLTYTKVLSSLLVNKLYCHKEWFMTWFFAVGGGDGAYFLQFGRKNIQVWYSPWTSNDWIIFP